MSSLMNALDNSRVTFPKSPWRYILLFQSWGQLLSWGVLVISTNVIINLALVLSKTELLPPEGVLIGTVLGSLFSVVMVLPAKLFFNFYSGHVLQSVTMELTELAYIMVESDDHRLVYRQNLHRLLRWNEGDVIIEYGDDCLVVKGPFIIIKKIQKNISRKTSL